MKAFTCIFCAIFLLHTPPGKASTESVAENGFIVTNSVTVAATPAQSWKALTENVDAWWPKDHSWWNGTFSMSATAGGCFCEVSGDRSAEHMRVVFVDPDKTLRMTGGLGPLQGMGMFGALNWQFSSSDEAPDATTITLRYHVQGYSASGYADLAPVVDKVQGLQLQALADFLQSDETD